MQLMILIVNFSAATINLNADISTDSAGQTYTSSTATNLGGSLTIGTSGAFTFGVQVHLELLAMRA